MIDLSKDIEIALKTLRKGGTILYPTDTIWGLGCDATNSNAVKKIFQLKNRLFTKSLIVLVDDKMKMQQYIEECPEPVCDLIEKAGTPLTVIFPGGKNVDRRVLAEDGSIAIRVVHHPFCTPLIKLLGKALVSTSANFSGEQAPANFSHIAKQLIGSVDYVVENFRDDVSNPMTSRIIRFDRSGNFVIIR